METIGLIFLFTQKRNHVWGKSVIMYFWQQTRREPTPYCTLGEWKSWSSGQKWNTFNFQIHFVVGLRVEPVNSMQLSSNRPFFSISSLRWWAYWTQVECHTSPRATLPSPRWPEAWSRTAAWLPAVMAPSAWRLYQAWPVCPPFLAPSLTAHLPTPPQPTPWTTIHPTSMDSTVRARYVSTLTWCWCLRILIF